MPALQEAMTSSGPETRNIGAEIKGKRILFLIFVEIGIEYSLNYLTKYRYYVTFISRLTYNSLFMQVLRDIMLSDYTVKSLILVEYQSGV